MRILFIIPNLTGGGAEKVTLMLCQGLSRRGHNVDLLLLEHSLQYSVPPELKLHSLIREHSRMSRGWLGRRLLARRLRQWHATQRREGEFDLIIAGLPLACEVAFLAGLTDAWYHIHNALASEIDQLEQDDPRGAARRRRRYQHTLDRRNLIAVSEGVKFGLREQLGLRNARIETIYNPFDFAEIARLAKELPDDLPARPYVIHAGRFVRQKRHDILLDAYAASGLPHALVLLVKEEPALMRLIRSRGLESRVIIAGFRANPFPWFAKASALILSSDHEGLSNVLVESLACGTPVVSTDCPSGPNEILTGPLARYLSPPGDIAALSHNLREAIKNPPTIERTNLDKFSLHIALDKFEALVSASRH